MSNVPITAETARRGFARGLIPARDTYLTKRPSGRYCGCFATAVLLELSDSTPKDSYEQALSTRNKLEELGVTGGEVSAMSAGWEGFDADLFSDPELLRLYKVAADLRAELKPKSFVLLEQEPTNAY